MKIEKYMKSSRRVWKEECSGLKEGFNQTQVS